MDTLNIGAFVHFECEIKILAYNILNIYKWFPKIKGMVNVKK